jgi:hypothetical protein
MTDQHPITPPQGLLEAWQARIESMGSNIPEILLDVVHWGACEAARAERDSAVRSAEFGADDELEACRQWLEINGAPREFIDGLLAARRPKPEPELTDEQLLKCFKIATPCYNMKEWKRELDGMRAAIAADRALRAELRGPEDSND